MDLLASFAGTRHAAGFREYMLTYLGQPACRLEVSAVHASADVGRRWLDYEPSGTSRFTVSMPTMSGGAGFLTCSMLQFMDGSWNMKCIVSYARVRHPHDRSRSKGEDVLDYNLWRIYRTGFRYELLKFSWRFSHWQPSPAWMFRRRHRQPRSRLRIRPVQALTRRPPTPSMGANYRLHEANSRQEVSLGCTARPSPRR